LLILKIVTPLIPGDTLEVDPGFETVLGGVYTRRS
jgi:hypothetical protein